MKNVIILGGSGAGMIAASVIERSSELNLLGFLNDNLEKGDYIGKFKKFPVLGKTADVIKYIEETDAFFFVAYEGIRNPYNSYKAWKNLPIPKDRYINIIDNQATVPEEFLQLGKGILAAPYVQISPDAIISDNVMLLGNAFVGHDSFVGEFSHITTNAVVGSFVHVGKGVTVGINSTIRERVHIGDFALIGAGSVVTKDVPPNTIVCGNPARVLRERGELDYLNVSPREVKY